MKRAGRYRLLDLIAEGGQAQVYRGLDDRGSDIKRLVAVKVVLGDLTSDPELKKAFLEETRVSLGLSHPNIAQTLDYGDEGGRPFIAFEYVQGRSLKQVFDRLRSRQQALPITVSTFIAEQVARALAYAHAFKDPLKGTPASIVHRDLSPHNIMISFEGAPKVIDFGIAKVLERTDAKGTQSGLIKGKPSYLSPEQIRGDTLDGRSDLFALGIVFWEALAGRRLFGTIPTHAIMSLVADGSAPFAPPSKFNPAVSPALDRIALRALERDRSLRYQNASELQGDLYPLLGQSNRDSYSLALSMVLRQLFDQEIEEEKNYLMNLLSQGGGLTTTLSLPRIELKEVELPATETARVVLERSPPSRPASASKSKGDSTGLKVRAGADLTTGEPTCFAEGIVDERADMMSVFNRLVPNCRLNLKGISRINSQGVKLWLQFFRQRGDSGGVTRYVECSTAITHFLGMFLRCGAATSVSSVYAPFACKTCNGYVEYLVQTPDFLAIKPQIQGRACPVCQGPLELAEFPEEYFSFLAV